MFTLMFNGYVVFILLNKQCALYVNLFQLCFNASNIAANVVRSIKHAMNSKKGLLFGILVFFFMCTLLFN